MLYKYNCSYFTMNKSVTACHSLRVSVRAGYRCGVLVRKCSKYILKTCHMMPIFKQQESGRICQGTEDMKTATESVAVARTNAVEAGVRFTLQQNSLQGRI
jgi:hypothetical protein